MKLTTNTQVTVDGVVQGNGGRAAFQRAGDLRALGYRTVEHVPTERATHVVLAK